MQLGRYGKNAGSNDLEKLRAGGPRSGSIPRPTKPTFADGYLNKRVGRGHADSGKMKRYWGAYGNKRATLPWGIRPESAPAQQFRNPVHCVERANDGLVYVCDRQGDRVQVFQPDGKFVKEGFYAKETLASGSAWDITFQRTASSASVPRRRPEREGAHHPA